MPVFAALVSWLTVVLPAPQAASADLSTNPVRFQQLTIQDGLSQAAVYDIVQDHEGFMWFGTQEGLNRYDGTRFEVFSHDPRDPESLSDNRVWSLLVSSSGQLWVGGDGGLDRFDPDTGTFEKPLAALLGNSGPTPRVRALLEDGAGQLWIGTANRGLLVLDPQTKGLETYRHDKELQGSLPVDAVTSLATTPEGLIWIGTDGGGLVERRLDGTFYAHRHEPSNEESLSEDRVRTLDTAPDGTLWIGTYSGQIDRFTSSSRTFESLPSAELEPRTASSRVRDLFHDSRGSLWVATDLGLEEWDARHSSARSYQHEAEDPYGLSDSRVISLYEDRGGVLWIGTWGGLNKANLSKGYFAHYSRTTGATGQISSNVVTSFAESPTTKLWVGTYGGGLDRFDPETGLFEPFSSLAPTGAKLSDARVMSLHSEANGVLWVGSFGAGLDSYDPATRKVKNFRHDPEDPTSLSSNGVTSILRDRSGRLWIGTYGGGLNLLNEANGTFKRFMQVENEPSSLPGNRVLSLHESQDGGLWVGVEGGGLNLFDDPSQGFKRPEYNSPQSGDQAIDLVSPYAVFEDQQGTFWIGSPKGLFSWDRTDRAKLNYSLVHYGKNQGLASSAVFGVLGEPSGKIWLSTNRGLVRFDPESQLFRSFDSSDGLQSEEFNSGAFLRASDGTMLFGGLNGFNSFHPEQIRSNSHIPPVAIRSFRRLNQEVDFGKALSAIEQIEIEHSDRMVTFEFAALDYTAPKKNQYRYRLLGFDPAWVESGVLNLATFTNLSAGNYTFEVQAANSDGLWNRVGTSVNLRVNPAPWRTWWAYTLYLTMVLAALAAFGRSQMRKKHHAQQLLASNELLQREVTDRKHAEQELHKLSLAVEQSPASVVITDHHGFIDYVNPKFEKSTGYTLEEMRGKRFDSLQSGYASKKTNEELWDAVLAGHEWRGELHQRRKTGEVLWEHASVSPIFSDKGQITHIVAVNEDITVRKRYEERLLHQAHHDHLTELPNRTLALDRLEGALARCRRSQGTVALLFVDLDNFKIVNDTLGHHAGDELLRTTARRLENNLREDDTVARLGGDEFLIILNDLASTTVAEAAARKLLRVFHEPFKIAGREIFVTASIGLTIAPEDGDDPHTLMSNADAAMYKAKDHGRDAYRFFTPKMNEQALERLRIENNLRQAIERDELQLKYQPIVETSTGRLVACEALLRWHNDELGWVSPARFIPIAEETGLVSSIGSWVISEVCRQIHEWQQSYDTDIHVDVNISSRQLRSGGLAEEVAEALNKYSLQPTVLGLEVTEHALLEDAPQTSETIDKLQRLGLRLAVDDFGTGYSALNNLKRFRFDTLKIDQTFIRDLLTEPEDQDLTRAIIAMAESLHLDVIAEGVETREHLEILQSFGCPHAQGFYFSEPLAPAEFESLLKNDGQRLASAV